MKQLDLSRITVGSIKGRHSKVESKQVLRKLSYRGVGAFVESLPQVLKAQDLNDLIAAIAAARKRNKPIIWMFGAHLVKVGLAPLMVEIIGAGYWQMVSTNNAGLIHDLELAFFGKTSEDVEAALQEGQFGMTRETCAHYSDITQLARERGIGLGEAAGIYINQSKAPHRQTSVIAAAARYGIPATVHVAIGTDVVNAHPEFDGAAVGAASQIDFKIHCHMVTQLKSGGVALNFGSAVILPEVFLKALAIARNLDPKFSRFTVANFDMLSLYRPRNNFVLRPRLLGATTYEFSGHHEIMLPLLWAALKDREAHRSQAGRTNHVRKRG